MKILIGIILSICMIITLGCGDDDFENPQGTVMGGQERGNGGDYLPAEHTSAWFLGEHKTITYCVEVAPHFGATKARATEAIEYAITTWTDYIQEKNINTYRSEMKLATQWSQQSRCNGKEDVSFYFGVRNAQVNQAMAYFFNPIAFSIRSTYDIMQGWGKGFVWFAPRASVKTEFDFDNPESKNFPDWQTPYNLEGMALHEIGHIFGNSHIDATIMDENFVYRLMDSHDNNSEPYRYSDLMQIDQARELVICKACATTVEGWLGMYSYSESTSTDPNTGEAVTGKDVLDTRAKVFKKLFARTPIGKISAKILLSEDGLIELVASDDQEEASFEIIIPDENMDSFTMDGLAFKTVYAESETAKTISFARSGSEVKHGFLITKSGVRIELSVQRNMISSMKRNDRHLLFGGRFLIQTFDQDGAQVLFQSSKP